MLRLSTLFSKVFQALHDIIMVSGCLLYTSIGCTLIQDEYVLFDGEGIVLGTSPIQPEGILFAEGIQAEEVKANEQLPVKEDRVFRNIVDLSEALAQYSIEPDRLVCNGANLTVYIGNVCVELGSGRCV